MVYGGGLLDRDTGLIHLVYRDYNPATAHFIQPDPLGYAAGDVEVYGWCLDDPVNLVDPLGLEGKSESTGSGGNDSSNGTGSKPESAKQEEPKVTEKNGVFFNEKNEPFKEKGLGNPTVSPVDLAAVPLFLGGKLVTKALTGAGEAALAAAPAAISAAATKANEIEGAIARGYHAASGAITRAVGAANANWDKVEKGVDFVQGYVDPMVGGNVWQQAGGTVSHIYDRLTEQKK